MVTAVKKNPNVKAVGAGRMSPRVAGKGSPRVAGADKKEDDFAGLAVRNIVYSNGATYDGQVNAMNQRHGQGKLKFAGDKAVFEGIFKGGMMSTGKISYLEQAGGECCFEGTFEGNQWHKGVYTKGGATYKTLKEGVFENQTMKGEFEITWPSKVVYKGNVLNNELQGKGTMTFPAGHGKIKEIQGNWKTDLEKCDLLTMQNGDTATNYNHL